MQIILEDLSPEKRLEYLNSRKKEEERDAFLSQYKDGQTFRYKLTVEGNAHVQSVKSDFKIVSIYDLDFIRYDSENNLYQFRLTEVSYTLEKYEDPVVAQIIEMSNMVSEIYKVLEFGVDRYGNMEKIYNREQIDKKWEKTKEYLTYKHPLTSFEIIKTKEKELKNPGLEIMNISFMHFLQVYFKQFGRFRDKENFEIMHMDQFGSGIPFDLGMTFDMEPEKDGLMHRKMYGEMRYNKDVEKNLRKIVKDNSADIMYETRADYYSNGVIIEEVNFSYEEKLGEGYNMYSYLHLELIKNEQ